MKKKLLHKSCAILLLGTNLFSAEIIEDEFSDDGFGEEEEIIVEQITIQKEKPYSIYGSVSFFNSYNYSHNAPQSSNQNDYRGWSSAKLSTDITSEYKFDNGYKIKSVLKAYKDFIYDIKDSSYPIVPQDYDKDIDFNELYLQGAINSKIDFKIGRQIIVWGKSDNIRITDILNPLDMTTPALTDIKDLRLGKAMSKFDYTKNSWTSSVILIHEHRYSTLPKYGSDFAPQNETMANSMIVDEPSSSLSNTGIALSLSGNLTGQDISLYYANDFVDNSTAKYNMIGFAYNKVKDNFLFKTEVADFHFYDTETLDNKTDALIGTEYNGIKDGSISLEIANKDNQIEYALRFNQSYMNETLDFTTLVALYGNDGKDGGYTRVWFDYDYNDNVSLNFGIVDYIDGNDPRFELMQNNDRIFTTFTYNF